MTHRRPRVAGRWPRNRSLVPVRPQIEGFCLFFPEAIVRQTFIVRLTMLAAPVARVVTPLRAGALVALALALFATPASAQTLTWGASGTGGAGTWNTSNLNWFNGANVAWPGSGTAATFGGTSGTVTISGSVQATDLTFLTSGYNITSGTLRLTNGVVSPTITLGTGITGTISSFVSGTRGLALSGGGALTLAAGNNALTGTATITTSTLTLLTGTSLGTAAVVNNGVLNLSSTSTPGTVTYTMGAMTGSGTINISNLGVGTASTQFTSGIFAGYTGVTNIGVGTGAGGGKVAMSGNDNAAATINVLTNATLYTTSGTHAASLFLNGGDTGESLGQLRLEGAIWSGTITLSGSIAGAGDAYVGANGGTGTVTGLITEATAGRIFSKVGGGTIVLTNTGNSYTGGTQIVSGPLQIASLNVLGATTGTVSFTGNGSLITGTNTSASGTFVYPLAALSTSGTLNTNGNSVAFSGLISGTGNLIKAGSGTATITGSNSLTGTTTAGAGVLELANVDALRTSILNLTTGSVALAVPGTNTYSLGGLSGTAGFDPGANSLALQGARNSTYSGTLAGSGGLTKVGSGTQTLSGTNTYTGPTTITGGVLAIPNRGGLYNAGTANWTDTNLITGSGATLALNVGGAGQFTSTDVAQIGSLGTGSTGFLNGSRLSLDTSGAGGAFTQSTGINNANAMTLVKLGSGTLVMSASSSYSGGTELNAGALSISDASGIGTGALTISGNSLVTTGFSGTSASNGVVINTGVTGTFDSQANAVTLPGAVTGAGAIIKLGSGTVAFSGPFNGTGAFTGSNGTVTISGDRTVSTAASGAYSVGGPGNNSTLNINLTSGTLNIGAQDFRVGNSTSNTATVNQTGGVVAFAGGNQLLIGNNGSGTSTYNLSGGSITTTTVAANRGIIIGTNSNTLVNTLNLSGSGTINMTAATGANGDGLLQVGRADSQANNTTNFFTQTGGVANIGILSIGGNGATSTGVSSTVSLTGGTFSANQFTFLAAGNTNSSTLYIGGSADVTLPAFPNARGVGSTATLILDGGILRSTTTSGTFMNNTLTTAAIAAGGATFNIASGRDISIAQNFTESGTSTGGGLTKAGVGVLTLSGSNSYTGATTVTSGSLRLGSSNAIGVPGTNLAVNGGTLDLVTFSPTVGTISGSAGAVITSATNGVATLTGSSASDSTYAGIITGSVALVKEGTGTLTLTGSNTYTRGTTINSGSLVANIGTSGTSIGSGTATINPNGFLQLLVTTTANSGTTTLANTLTGSGNVGINFNSGTAARNTNITASTLSTLSGTLFLTSTGGAGGDKINSNGSVFTSPGALSIGNNTTYYANGSGTFSSGIFVTGSGNNENRGAIRIGNGTTLGGPMTLLGSSTIGPDTPGTATISGNIGSTGTNVLTIGTVSQTGNLVLSGTLSDGTGQLSLVKVQTGTLTLSQNNSFTGGAQLNGGVTLLNNVGGLGTGTATFTASSAVRTGVSGTVTTPFAINSGVTGTFDPQGTTTMTLGGPITGSGTFVKVSTGTVAISGSNTFTGGSRLTAGLTSIGSMAALGTGTVTYTGTSSLQATVSGTFTNPILLSGSGVNATFNTLGNSVVMTGSNVTSSTNAATFVKAGSGILTFSTNALYTGTTIITGGTLALTGSYASATFNIQAPGSALVLNTANAANRDYGVATTFSGSGNLIKTGTGAALWGSASTTFALSSSGTIDVQQGNFTGGSNNNENWTSNQANLNVAAGAAFNGVEASVRVNALTGSGTIASGFASPNGTFTFGVANGSGTFAGSLRNGSAQNLGWVKLGTGTQALSGASTYTGTTSIQNGVLQLGAGGSTGSLATGGASLITGSAAGTFAINRSNTVTQGTDFPTILTGSIAVVQIGTGTTILNSSSNAYQGGTRVEAGELRLGNAGALGSTAGSLGVNGGTLNLNGLSPTVGAFSGLSAGVVTSVSPAILTTSSTASTTFAGSFTGAAGLTQNGTGLVNLTGSSSSTGAFTVNSGSLAVNGVLGTGPMTVAAVGWLQGSGTIGGDVNVLGTLSPGNSPGIITLGSVTLGASSTTIIEINDLVRGTDYDGVNITGTSSSLTYGGLLSLNFGSLSPDDVTYDIFNFAGGYLGGYTTVTSTGAYIGTWADIGGGQFQLVSGAQTLTFDQATGDIIVVPEPAAIVLAGLGLAGVAAAIRRRLRKAPAGRRDDV
jgi:fibronectin-binding autotransporter adhesin